MSDPVQVTVSVHPDRVSDLHAHVNNYLQTAKRKYNKPTRFSDEDLAEIQRLYLGREKKQVELASTYACSQGTISTIISTGKSTRRSNKQGKET